MQRQVNELFVASPKALSMLAGKFFYHRHLLAMYRGTKRMMVKYLNGELCDPFFEAAFPQYAQYIQSMFPVPEGWFVPQVYHMYI